MTEKTSSTSSFNGIKSSGLKYLMQTIPKYWHVAELLETYSDRLDEPDWIDSISIIKGKRSYTSSPQRKPSTSTDTSTFSTIDFTALPPLYFIKINDDNLITTSTPQFLIKEYQDNQMKQTNNHSLCKRPLSLAFFKICSGSRP
ncbi:hypothetical protein BC941DRAFT_472372 [Chlamydoabsidia padenii]|nr:hypothetical protein BC941DRAFT_472372 [Chlamydoabsidia padenii]